MVSLGDIGIARFGSLFFIVWCGVFGGKEMLEVLMGVRKCVRLEVVPVKDSIWMDDSVWMPFFFQFYRILGHCNFKDQL